MIFAALGTHEQPMARLVQALEVLAKAQPRRGPFVIQFGTSRVPDGWQGFAMMPKKEIASWIDQAEVIICHGGPATIAEVRAHGKIPIVVPRQRRFREHVDDHQVHYARRLAASGGVIVVEDVRGLEGVVLEFPRLIRDLPPPRPHDPREAIRHFARMVSDLT